jgi:hypothetical protein
LDSCFCLGSGVVQTEADVDAEWTATMGRRDLEMKGIWTIPAAKLLLVYFMRTYRIHARNSSLNRTKFRVNLPLANRMR